MDMEHTLIQCSLCKELRVAAELPLSALSPSFVDVPNLLLLSAQRKVSEQAV
jgi:hypothetical protein